MPCSFARLRAKAVQCDGYLIIIHRSGIGFHKTGAYVSRSSNNQVHSTDAAVGLLAEEIPAEIFVENGIFSRTEWEGLSEKLGLSPRQAQVANLLLMGLADKQIASKLDISTHTLRTYLDRMFTKMQVSDRCELIVHIFREFRAGCNGCCPRIQ